MTNGKACGAIELSSVAIGYEVQDEMLKAASVEILIARTICSGKYLIMIGGRVSDVEAAVQVGLDTADEAVIDHLVVANVFEGVFPALGMSVELSPDHSGALGVIETFSGTSALVAADVAGKAARVTIVRLFVAMALGGKGFVLLTGSVADVRAAVEAGADEARRRGLLVADRVIARPSPELFAEYL